MEKPKLITYITANVQSPQVRIYRIDDRSGSFLVGYLVFLVQYILGYRIFSKWDFFTPTSRQDQSHLGQLLCQLNLL